MFSKTLLAALFAATLVLADPTPSAPGPGDVFNQGADCKIEWSPDTTGTWTQMSIELMTGANLDMKHLTTVTTLDATKTTSYTWPCPAVTPNSAIYFYQFTSPAPNTTTLWTTRFGIASTDGHLDPPTEQTQPGSNQAIPWGNGALVDPSEAKPPPAGASSASGAAVSGSAGPGGASVSASASSAAPSGFTTSASTPVVVTQSPSASASAKSSGSAAGGASKPASSSAVPSSGAAAANGAVGNSVRGGVSGVVVALVGVVAGVVVAF